MLRRQALIVIGGILGLGCGAREIRLDHDAPSDSGAFAGAGVLADGSSVVLGDQESAMSIAVDATRLYWYSALPNAWSATEPVRYGYVRSCRKTDCASTIVTYDSIHVDQELTPTASYAFLALATDGANVYWAKYQKGGQSILSCPSEGCAGAPRVVASTADVSSMVVDGAYIYWTSPSDTAIMRSPASDSGNTPAAIVLNETRPRAIAVNATDVYWIANAADANASIRRAPKDGSKPAVTIAAEQNQAAALTLTSQFVYWANSYSVGTISRCPLDDCSGLSTVVASNQSLPLAVVADGQAVYWITSQPQAHLVEVQGTVQKCSLDDCGTTLSSLASQHFAPAGAVMALDATHVYWVAQGDGQPQNTGFYPHAGIYRAAK